MSPIHIQILFPLGKCLLMGDPHIKVKNSDLEGVHFKIENTALLKSW